MATRDQAKHRHTSLESLRSAARRGGSRTASDSPAKAAALARLHSSRRGRPVHPRPPSALWALARIHEAGEAKWGREANPVSYRQMAREIGVDPRTLLRWLARLARPAVAHHDAIRRVAKHYTRPPTTGSPRCDACRAADLAAYYRRTAS